MKRLLAINDDHYKWAKIGGYIFMGICLLSIILYLIYRFKIKTQAQKIEEIREIVKDVENINKKLLEKRH